MSTEQPKTPLPSNWKYFRAANVLFLIPFFYFLFSIAKGLVQKNVRFHNPGLVLVIFTCCVLTVICCLLNLYLFQKHYPDKPMSATLVSWHRMLTVIVTIFVIIIWFVLLLDLSRMSQPRPSFVLVMYAAIMLILTFPGMYVLVQQFYLPGALTNNYNKKMEAMLNELGNPEQQKNPVTGL